MNPILGIVASSISGSLLASSYESIATVTIGSGGASSISFTSIPSTYKHLQIRALVGSTVSAGNSMNMYFNTDSTTTNYYQHNLRGNGSTATAGAANIYRVSYTAGSSPNFGAHIIDILEYTNTSKNKTVRTLSGYDANGSGNVSLNSELWSNTAAVNAITLTLDGSQTFQQYSSFALYGIKG
jgi:hypothetical protein